MYNTLSHLNKVQNVLLHGYREREDIFHKDLKRPNLPKVVPIIILGRLFTIKIRRFSIFPRDEYYKVSTIRNQLRKLFYCQRLINKLDLIF